MTTLEKISAWITKQEEAGVPREKIAGTVLVTKVDNGTYTTHTLSKSGKTKYNVKSYVGAVDLDAMEVQ